MKRCFLRNSSNSNTWKIVTSENDNCVEKNKDNRFEQFRSSLGKFKHWLSFAAAAGCLIFKFEAYIKEK